MTTGADISPDFLTSLGVQLGPDSLIAEKYRVERLLGRGGVGVVVQAVHLRLNQRVAVKLLLPTAMPDAVVRFTREAQAAARLKNEHIARVLDVGEMPNGTPFMVMEFLEGCDLEEHLRNRGFLAPREAVDYILQACEALAEAHAAGIVHRDLKPANLFLTKRADGGNTIKLLDFGISKDEGLTKDGGPSMKLTQTTAVFGSPLYMSPEQMRSARFADARSDIWSIGVILYELCTGKPPFDADMYPELVLKVTLEPPPPPSSIRHDLPSKLESVILRCLEKDPAKRFFNVAKLAEALVPFASEEAAFSAGRATDTLKSQSQGSLSQSEGKGASASQAKDAEDRISKAESKPFVLIGAALSGALIAIGSLWFLASYLYASDTQQSSIETQAQGPAPLPISPSTGSAAPIVVMPTETAGAQGSSAAVLPSAPASSTGTAAPIAKAPNAPAPTALAAAPKSAGPSAPPPKTSAPAEEKNGLKKLILKD